MKIDPLLLRRLEERGDPNELLAMALGVCPRCGQPLPGTPDHPAAKREGLGSKSAKSRAALEYMREHPKASRREVAKAVGLSAARISQIVRAHREENGGE